MKDFGVSPASSESIDGMSESEKHDAITTETPVPTNKSRHDEIINKVLISSVGKSDGAIFDMDMEDVREIFDGHQCMGESSKAMPLIEQIADESQEDAKANVTVKEVAVASNNQQKQTTSTFGAPVGPQKENPVPALEVGARVGITGGSYKGHYGTVEKVMKVKVQVNIDGLGSKRPEIKNVMVVGTTITNDTPMSPSPSCATIVLNENDTVVSQNDKTAAEEPTTFEQGQTVLIVGGSKTEHVGKQGTITKVTQKMVQILLPGEAKPVSKSMKSVQLVTTCEDTRSIETRQTELEPLLGVTPKAASANKPFYRADRRASEVILLTTTDSETAQTDESKIYIIDGKYKDLSGRLEDATEKTVKVYIPSLGKSVRVKRANTSIGNTSVHSTSFPDSSPFNVGEDWRLPGSGTGGMRWGTRMIVKIRLQSQGAKRSDHNFLTQLFQDRLIVTEIPMNQEETRHPLDVEWVDKRGFGHELVSSKIQNDGEVGGGRHCKPKCVRLVYAQVFGPQQTTYSLKEELERLGDFASLDTRKVLARLELLQSPAYQFNRSGKKDPAMFALSKSDFIQFTHERNDGCGFISDDLLTKLCSQGGPAVAKRALALQVRAVIPEMGIYKGVLMRKRIPPGEPQIQLMPSMQKVGPSRNADTDDRAFLWITQAGMHPSSNNVMMARKLDPNEKYPPTSFIKNVKKVSDDVLRLWQTLGVPEDVCETYAKNSFGKLSHLQHASVVGVADPTNSIPPGQVFVTGMWHMSQESIFVTRFPCNHPTDGRILSNVTDKPQSMAESDWIWLKELPFGAIIFADAKEGMQPLPVHIADGDLDGDLYFVCWDAEILEQLNAEPVLDTALDVEDEAPTRKAESQPDENWLKKAQQQMVDTTKVYDMSILTGKLYNLAKTAATENKELITRDPEAMAFASAYKEALKHGKHGGKISLPDHLRTKIPERLHHYLTTSSPPL
jgi:ribosomal protein L24